MTAILGWVVVCVLLPMSLLVAYQWVLAVVSVLPRKRSQDDPRCKRLRFLVLIPAHNEQHTLPRTLQSLSEIRYPSYGVHVIVVADRCEDATAAVARRHGFQCLERFTGVPGKGAAIAWAIERLQKDIAHYDALVILDADTLVNPLVFKAFNDGLIMGHHVQQGYNYISNPWETPFTRIIAVTSILRNGLFYAGKSRIGLTGMLMGTGMCFSRHIVERHGWTAFSVGEDLEFSVSLLLNGEKIYFNPMARVFARESGSFRQASTQRLRWSSGRHAVAASSAWKLFMEGLRRRRLHLWDGALTLLAPNYSAQATLAIFSLLIAWFLSRDPAWYIVFIWAEFVMGFLTAYFLLGVALTGAPAKTLTGIALIPVFLPWRMAIEILGLLGYGRKRWVRSTHIAAFRQGPTD